VPATTTEVAHLTAAHILAAKPQRIVTIGPSARLGEAVSLLVVHRIGALLVTDAQGELVGIISERDIVWALRHGPESMRAPVASVMTADLHVATPDSTCAALMRTMTEERIRHLPIVDGSQLVGVVSIGDVVHASLGTLAPGF